MLQREKPKWKAEGGFPRWKDQLGQVQFGVSSPLSMMHPGQRVDAQDSTENLGQR